MEVRWRPLWLPGAWLDRRELPPWALLWLDLWLWLWLPGPRADEGALRACVLVRCRPPASALVEGSPPPPVLPYVGESENCDE